MHRNPNSWHLLALFFMAMLLFCMGNIQGNPLPKPDGQKVFVLENSPPVLMPAINVSIPVIWEISSMPGLVFNQPMKYSLLVNMAGSLYLITGPPGINNDQNNNKYDYQLNFYRSQRGNKCFFIKPREKI
jgi:hypothetical protein